MRRHPQAGDLAIRVIEDVSALLHEDLQQIGIKVGQIECAVRLRILGERRQRHRGRERRGSELRGQLRLFTYIRVGSGQCCRIGIGINVFDRARLCFGRFCFCGCAG